MQASYRSTRALTILLCALISVSNMSVLAQTKGEEEGIQAANTLSAAFERAARIITPSVVNVSALKKAKPTKGLRGNLQDPFFDPFREFFGDEFADKFGGGEGGGKGFAQQGLGTGVIVDDKGFIVTNNHVVDGADEIKVKLPSGQTVKAEIIGADARTDLAIIRVKAKDLSAAKLGDSDKLKIGEWVVAAGNPFGLDNSITAGIVSAKGRSFMGGGQFEDFIQTDAAINPGNSGGPLVNLQGEVVGINTAIFTRSGGYMGIGFAIPVNMAKNVMSSLIDHGKVVRGWLGVIIQNMTEEMAKSFDYPNTEGALVGDVSKGSPAEKAGLKQGDIIAKFGEIKIKDTNQLRNLVANTAPGTNVELSIVRAGKKEVLTLKIGELKASEEKGPVVEKERTDLGISVQDITPDLAHRMGIETTGVMVKVVQPGSIAANAGIRPRDIIVSVNGVSTATTNEFYDAVDKGDLKKGIRLVVESDGLEHFVLLRADDDVEQE